LKDGDVLVANHPITGGTHLPDVTVITPVFAQGTKEIIFMLLLVAITPTVSFQLSLKIPQSLMSSCLVGGILPGSMPPKSTELWQEGTAIESEKVVEDGVFSEARMRELFLDIPSKFNGCSGSRNISDNISDLKAQIAANTRGIALVQNLIDEYSLETVQLYMYAIQTTAELAVRNLLKGLHKRYG